MPLSGLSSSGTFIYLGCPFLDLSWRSFFHLVYLKWVLSWPYFTQGFTLPHVTYLLELYNRSLFDLVFPSTLPDPPWPKFSPYVVKVCTWTQVPQSSLHPMWPRCLRTVCKSIIYWTIFQPSLYFTSCELSFDLILCNMSFPWSSATYVFTRPCVTFTFSWHCLTYTVCFLFFLLTLCDLSHYLTLSDLKSYFSCLYSHLCKSTHVFLQLFFLSFFNSQDTYDNRPVWYQSFLPRCQPESWLSLTRALAVLATVGRYLIHVV